VGDRLKSELAAFQPIWKGGYYEGDPLQPVKMSKYGVVNYVSTLHATYLRCIKPYVRAQTVALEIGPGRGAWTRTLLAAREVWALDALSAEHNQTFEFLGHPQNLRYFQVTDFECAMLPENYFDYVFSYGCLCHVSFHGITEYARHLFPKLKSGANGFWLVADYDKYNHCATHLNDYSVWRNLTPPKPKYRPLGWFLRGCERFMNRPKLKAPDADDTPAPARWYHAGTQRTCQMLRETGYQIVDEDVGTCHRDPIIHFVKP
jgi:hypothetical protein